jgi:hypothetical protein
MTLSTLKTMNVQMDDLRDSLKIRMPGSTPAGSAEQKADGPGSKAPAKTARKTTTAAGKKADGETPVDPMQWWGALTKQFTQLAASAMKDTATDAAKNLAGAMVKQSFDAAGQTLRKAVSVPANVARKSAAGARKRSSKAT